MANFALSQVVITPNQTINKQQTYSGSLGLSIVEVAAPSATTAIFFTLSVANTKAFTISCDVACTIKTNNSTTPANTLVLVANKPYVWVLDSYDTFKLTVDVTQIFVVVAGAVSGNVQIEAIVDATP